MKKNKIFKIIHLLKITLFPFTKKAYVSETSKIRHLVLNYCIGKGADIGFGGDKIVKENCLGIDLKTPYAFTGKDKVDIPCNLFEESLPLENNVLDYLYSSHLIEDFEDTEKILIDFFRVVKHNGYVILVFPHQLKYEEYCFNNNQQLNPHHIHKNMSLNFMIEKLNNLENRSILKYKLIFSSDCEIDYNVVMVLKKL